MRTGLGLFDERSDSPRDLPTRRWRTGGGDGSLPCCPLGLLNNRERLSRSYQWQRGEMKPRTISNVGSCKYCERM